MFTSRQWRGHAVAVLATAAAAGIRWQLADWLHRDAPFLPFTLPVVAAAWYGGLFPGLFATLLGLLAGAYFFSPPILDLAIESPGGRLQAGMFVAVGVCMSALCEALHRHKDAAEAAAADAERRRAEFEREAAERREAERRVRSGEEELRLVTDYAPVLLAHYDRDERYGFVNRPYAEWFGLRREEVIGRRVRDVLGDDVYALLRPRIAEALEGRAVEFEIDVPHPRLGRRTLHFAYRPQLAAAGAVAGLVATIIDVTERVRAEASLRAEERRFRAVVEASPAGLVLVDRAGSVVLANEPAERMFGYSADELLGRPVERLIPERFRRDHPEHRRRFFAAPEARAMGEGRDLWAERKNGEAFPVEVGLRPVEMDDGPHVLASIVDVTPRRKAQEALRRSEAMFRHLADAMPQIVWTAGPDGTIEYFNERWFEYTGRPRDAGVEDWSVALHPDDVEPSLAAWRAAVESGRPFEIERRFRHAATGEYRWHLGRALPVRDEAGRVSRWFGTSTDIHDQKRAEEELRELNRTLEKRVAERTEAAESGRRLVDAILDALPVSVLIADTTGALTMHNRAAERVWGPIPPTRGVDEYERWLGFWPETGARIQWHEWALARALMHGESCSGELVEFVRFGDGSRRTIMNSGAPVFGPDGAVVAGIAASVDVTDRLAAEAALRESEERFRNAFEGAPIGMALVAPDGRWLRVNGALCEILGYSEAELLATDFQSITHPDDLSAELALIERMLAGERRASLTQKRYIHKSGRAVHALSAASLVRDRNDAPLHFVAQIQDVTERIEGEARVRASLHEKEVLLKEIHHRVKNNLQIVSTLLDLQSAYTPDPKAAEMFQESRGRVKSMALIHERLYRSDDLAHVDLGLYLQRLAEDLQQAYRAASNDAEIELDVAAPPLALDVAIPCGLLINELISNCFKHAFRDRSAGRIRVSLRGTDEECVLRVADDGVGFPDGLDFRDSPSFGLQLVVTLVEQLRGEIVLNREAGTEFVVRFPGRR